jgi:hypothetical protein
MLATVALGAAQVNLKLAQVELTLCFTQLHIIEFWVLHCTISYYGLLH